MGKEPTKRLDLLLVEQGLADTPEQAQAFILAGEVFDDKARRLDKAGTKIPANTPLELRSRKEAFASRGGHKLEHAFRVFQFSVLGRVGMDVGASTGGFTDCLLKHGAKHIFALDVGYGLLDSQLRKDTRVTNAERVNARFIKPEDLETKNPLAKEISFAVMDVSFISLRQTVEPLVRHFPSLCELVLLFKPQFEVDRKYVLKGGVVKDEAVIQEALLSFSQWAARISLTLRGGPETSPLPGKKSGNVEYLLHYGRN
jgi:23S rRNA (cytidine1920-2'-O)/16S rRNA (cytidine1409-2'-O)-methyltransferase